MKLLFVALPLAAALAHGPAHASRVLGAAPPRPADHVEAVAPPAPQRGVIAAIREATPQGVQVQIDGRWLLAKRGRTQVLRNGLPLDDKALVPGQAVGYTLASTAEGETALGVVDLH